MSQEDNKCKECKVGIMSEMPIGRGEGSLTLFVCSHCDYQVNHIETLEEEKESALQKIKKLEEIYAKNVFGYEDLKPFIIDVVNVHYNKRQAKTKPNHLLLVGEPGTCKTYFFELLGKVFDNDTEYEFLNAATTSGAGIASHLDDTKKVNTLRFVILDEIDKMLRNQQIKLLTALETGVIKEVKFKRYIDLDVSNILFLATANHKERVYEPLLNRFMVIDIPHYSYTDYRKITDGWIKKVYPENADILIDTIFPNPEIRLDNPDDRIHIRTLKKLVNLSLGNADKLASYLATLERYTSDDKDKDDED